MYIEVMEPREKNVLTSDPQWESDNLMVKKSPKTLVCRGKKKERKIESGDLIIDPHLAGKYRFYLQPHS